MNNPFFTVIIPTYNRASMLKRAIDSVLAQNFLSFELVVVDDGSTDDTQTTVDSINDERLHYKKIENSERGAARNTGIRLSRGYYVTFLDSDDFFYPHHLDFVHRKLAQFSMPEVYHQGYVIMNAISERVLQKPYGGHDLGRALFTRGNIMSCMGVFIRREIVLHNMFNENRLLAGMEDWELWIRLASKFPIKYSREITSVLLEHEERGSVQVERSRLEDKCNLFLQSVSANPDINSRYGRFMPHLIANVYTYMSLHLSDVPGERKAAWHFLSRAIKLDMSRLLKKRTVVIIRNLLFT